MLYLATQISSDILALRNRKGSVDFETASLLTRLQCYPTWNTVARFGILLQDGMITFRKSHG